MRLTTLLLAAATGLVALVFPASSPDLAQTALAQTAAALSGQVSSGREGLMEGVTRGRSSAACGRCGGSDRRGVPPCLPKPNRRAVIRTRRGTTAVS